MTEFSVKMTSIDGAWKEQLAAQLKKGLSYKDCLKLYLEKLEAKRRNSKYEKLRLDNSEDTRVAPMLGPQRAEERNLGCKIF